MNAKSTMALSLASTPIPHILSKNASNGESIDHHTRILHHLNQCTNVSQLKQIHAQVLRTTLPNQPQTIFLYSRILYFASLSDIDYANCIFDQMENPSSFMWNALIRGCARKTETKEEAILIYCRMLKKASVGPDKHTFPFVLKACAYLFALVEGKQLHCQVLKLGLGSDVYVNNSLIHFYASCGCLGFAQKLFDKMPDRSVVSWNVMIDAFVREGEFDYALKLFRVMQQSFDLDGYTMQSVISACAGLCALSLGFWTHAYVLKKCAAGLGSDVLVMNSLIDMYCKCGALTLAEQVFERMHDHNLASWNSMILGLASHGKTESALNYFTQMVKTENYKPDSITFVGVLSACNHNGMVEVGRKYFRNMVEEYGIEPVLEHYGCMVDLLARAGFLDEALNIVSTMKITPDVVIWRSLLDACSKENVNLELSEKLAEQILETDKGNSSGVYVLLSRVYASANKWNHVGLIRKLMTDQGLQKEPGCSLIEINGVTHELFAGDTSHPETNKIYKMLDVINERINLVGYYSLSGHCNVAPLVDDDKDVKQSSVQLHSERLAIALGLLKLERGVPIRVFKNLRVCGDCHEVTKLISRVFDVEIVVRDRVRFHRFKDGCCSCMDYW